MQCSCIDSVTVQCQEHQRVFLPNVDNLLCYDDEAVEERIKLPDPCDVGVQNIQNLLLILCMIAVYVKVEHPIRNVDHHQGYSHSR